MAKKGKSKKPGNPNNSQAKKNGIFSAKRDAEKGQSQGQRATTRANRMTAQNTRKGG